MVGVVVSHSSHGGPPSTFTSLKNDKIPHVPHGEDIKGLLSICPNDDYAYEMTLLLVKEVIEANRYKNMGDFKAWGGR